MDLLSPQLGGRLLRQSFVYILYFIPRAVFTVRPLKINSDFSFMMQGLKSSLFLAGLLLVSQLTTGATSQVQNGSSIYKARFEVHEESTPRYQNVTGRTANPMVRALLPVNSSDSSLHKRADNGLPTGTCAPGTPCSNGACCSNVSQSELSSF